MSLQSIRDVEASREKLRRLEDRYKANECAADGSDHVRELSRRSLKRLINQLTEEIARFEAHSTSVVSRG